MMKECNIKICGLTRMEEATYLGDAKVDYAGFVLFFPKSKRYVTIAQAKEIFKGLPAEIKKVAVVVSPSLEQVRAIEEAGFDILQVHGALLEDVKKSWRLPIWKALQEAEFDQYEAYLQDEKITGFVFDAASAGSGKPFDWHALKGMLAQKGINEKTFVLAGGLTAQNVKEAMALLHPDVVDVSSAVEYEDKPGKDPTKIEAFVAAVKR